MRRDLDLLVAAICALICGVSLRNHSFAIAALNALIAAGYVHRWWQFRRTDPRD